MNINNIVSSYISQNGTGDLEKIQSSFNNIREAIYENHDNWEASPYTIDKNTELSEEEFLDLMCQFTGLSSDEIKEDVNVLFSVLDTDEEGAKGKLSQKELEIFLDNNSQMAGYDVWNKLTSYEADKVSVNSGNEAKTAAETEKASEGKTANSDTSGTTATGTNTKTTEAQTDASKNTETNNEIDANMKKYINAINTIVSAKSDDDINCAEDVISNWLNEGLIDESTANELRSYYTTYSDEDEQIISSELEVRKISNPNITRAEVITILTKEGRIGDPQTTSKAEDISGKSTNKAASIALEAVGTGAVVGSTTLIGAAAIGAITGAGLPLLAIGAIGFVVGAAGDYIYNKLAN